MQHIVRGKWCLDTSSELNCVINVHLNWNNQAGDWSTSVNLGSCDGAIPHLATLLGRDALPTYLSPSKDTDIRSHIHWNSIHISNFSASMTSESVNGSFEPSAVQDPNVQGGTQGQKAHEEYQYLDLIKQILAEGEHRPDRYFAHDR